MFPQSPSEQNLSLQLTQLFPAAKDRVFRAWTQKDALEKWFGPEGLRTTVLELELNEGGRYRFQMAGPEGPPVDVYGQYVEIVPEEKLVFTWRWEDWENGVSDSLVTVEFKEKGQFTEVQLTHTQLPSEEQVNAHTFGWTSTLASMEKFFG